MGMTIRSRLLFHALLIIPSGCVLFPLKKHIKFKIDSLVSKQMSDLLVNNALRLNGGKRKIRFKRYHFGGKCKSQETGVILCSLHFMC